jgi:flagellin-like hook-associated protein FlgL
MNEKEEFKMETELQWVQYRMKMLDIIDEKLLQMKQLAEQVKQDVLTEEERVALNTRLNELAAQVRAIDSESRRIEDGKILE